jgi:hypothetical protein
MIFPKILIGNFVFTALFALVGLAYLWNPNFFIILRFDDIFQVEFATALDKFFQNTCTDTTGAQNYIDLSVFFVLFFPANKPQYCKINNNKK